MATPVNIAPQLLDSGSTDDWRRAITAQHSMLVEGPRASIQAVLHFLTPYLQEPVAWLRRRIPLVLPKGAGALVVEDVAALNRQDQTRLQLWLDEPAHRRQVVSTSEYPVFPLVDCGLFDARLYFRLNVVRFSVGEEERGESPAPTAQRSCTALE